MSRLTTVGSTTDASYQPTRAYIPVPSISQNWEIKREDLKLGRLLGEGDYGNAYEAVWRGTKVTARIVEGKVQADH